MGHPTLPGAVGVNLHFHWRAGVTQQAWRHNPPRLTNNSAGLSTGQRTVEMSIEIQELLGYVVAR